MSLNNQENTQEVPKTLVQSVTRKTYSDGESEKTLEVYNIEWNIKNGAYQFFTANNNHIVLVRDKVDENLDVQVIKFIPWDESDYLEVSIDGEIFKWEIQFTNKKMLALSAESEHIKPWVIIHIPKKIWQDFNKVEIDEKNIEKYKYRKLIFSSIDFSNDECDLGSYDKDWFHEITESASKTSWNIKWIIWAILWAWIMYWAQNLNSNDIDSSSSSFREFAAETRNKVSDSLKSSKISYKKIPVIPNLWALTILENIGISDFDASIVKDIVLIKWDMITVTYKWNKLISMKNQNGREFYK